MSSLRSYRLQVLPRQLSLLKQRWLTLRTIVFFVDRSERSLGNGSPPPRAGDLLCSTRWRHFAYSLRYSRYSISIHSKLLTARSPQIETFPDRSQAASELHWGPCRLAVSEATK
jgi:hypothetical protein